MAEERIEVKVWKNPFTCEDCEFGPRPKCGFQTPCLPADYLPTRQQAIEFMAKAMSETYFNDVHASEPDMLEALAAAALDALVDK